MTLLWCLRRWGLFIAVVVAHNEVVQIQARPASPVGVNTDVSKINQEATDRGHVLNPSQEEGMQLLMKKQRGSTVRRFSQSAVDKIAISAKRKPAIVSEALIIPEDERRTRSQHSSTIVEVAPGEMLAAWFGGTFERMGDVGIWLSRFKDGRWGEAKEIVRPMASKIDGETWMEPCWNPILVQNPHTNTLFLFIHVGFDVRTWRPYMLRSVDKGATWDAPRQLPRNLIGPAKNKPIVLSDGTMLAGASDESRGWTCHVEVSRDNGETWKRSPTIAYDGWVIQPTLFETSKPGEVRMLMRSKSGVVVTASSRGDYLKGWSKGGETSVPNPNSGIDAVMLKDGRVLLVYNPLLRGRNILALGISHDDGLTFKKALLLENTAQTWPQSPECTSATSAGKRPARLKPEYSYPAIIQSPSTGLVHITYTFSYFAAGRRCDGRENIKHVVIDPCELPHSEDSAKSCPARSKPSKITRQGL
uniref:Sialidase domain-containing protein n=1 Tax=Pyramimonas obovata TaxID=1411642 RepID=A0A7S0WW52_9CHLO|mmetsp:Transcript_7154/g.14510  ORF Transcript_7154/g.14510 Transcript_7154/m.14510 type:complete len:474 (+) Transcript_7154:103-1524(+)|eukprot:CAMPEP_0118926154 /NCGR_PEP_ID=MMETSP1169-20130426/3919_1 /TAXON_ID=36882 /ORGANISM="Pyramimonas obovata, Strain CCMP722" /LENGTH=473 /DNA_ID=CAMNT_0006867651 /DNA_START=84 /DNA_END=1505 /DNA_ORIENTATION=-